MSLKLELPALETKITGYLAEKLGLPVETIHKDAPFNKYGATSAHLVGLVHYLETETKRNLTPTLAWEYPSIAELSRYLVFGDSWENASDNERASKPELEEIAIVGMSCRFPMASSLDAYWNLCWNGIDAITEVPDDRWDVNALYDPDPQTPGKTYARWGGFLEKLDRFDAAFFEISPREALHFDPRQRLILETSWEALEDAGIPANQLAGSNTGVFFATLSDDYGGLVFADPQRIEVYSGVGTAHSMIANRLSFFFDFHGPSLTVDTACSGSLVALHLACQSLRSHECNVALSGGVNVLLSPNSTLFFSRAGALSKNGRCKTFDSSADGFVRSEGAGAIVLKRLSDALADGDRVYAVIRGSAVNQDGRTNGIMAPSQHSQESVLLAAYRNARIPPGLSQYVEAHGTGTALGDPIEAQALGNVLDKGRPSGLGCLVGSVKTNIGHTEAAAGIAGIIKVALAIHRGKLPKSLHYREPNPLIPFDSLPFKVAESSGEWPDSGRRLIAGVSGFGFGGTNAHIVLAASPPTQENGKPTTKIIEIAPLFLSAQNQKALRELAAEYSDLLNKTDISLESVVNAARWQRSGLKYRLSLLADSRENVLEALGSFAQGQASERIIFGAKPAHSRRLAFVYSGQGSHWTGMGLKLMGMPPFGDTIRHCDALSRRYGGYSIIDAIGAETDVDNTGLARTDIAQTAIFTIQASLTTLFRSFGIIPDVVIGQSLGEVAASFASGALSLEDAFRVAHERGRLMRQVQGSGKTAQIGLPMKDTVKIIEPWGKQVCIAGSSSPNTTVIAGNTDVITEIISRLENQNVFARLLKGVDLAFHSPVMDPLCEPLMQSLTGINPRETEIPFFSSVEATYVNGERLNPAYWANNLRKPFLFSSALGKLSREDISIFLEISPHPVLGSSISEGIAASAKDGLTIATMRRGADEISSVADSCGHLFVQGFAPDWFNGNRGSVVSLPKYPWQRESYWIDDAKSAATLKHAQHHPFLGEYLRLAIPPRSHVWEIDLNQGSPHFLADHKVFGRTVFPGAGYVEMALAAASQIGCGLSLDNIRFEKALTLPQNKSIRVQIALTANSDGYTSFEIHECRSAEDGRGPHGATELHAVGRVCPHSGNATSKRKIDDLYSDCSISIPSETHYQGMAERGLDYGERFRAFTDIRLGTGKVLAKIEAPSTLKAEWNIYHIHPVCLDALFQLVALTVANGEDNSYLPVGIEKLELLQKPGSKLLGHAVLRDREITRDSLVADLELLQPNGEVVARVSGLELRKVGAGYNTSHISDDPASWGYDLAWVEHSFDIDAETQVASGINSWLIFGAGGNLADELSALLSMRGGKVVRIEAGSGFHESEYGASYTLNAGSPGDYRRMFEMLESAGLPEPWGLIGLWALEKPDAEGAAQALSVKTLALLQAIIEVENLPRLMLVTRGSQKVAEAPVTLESVHQAVVWGLGRTAMHSEINGLHGILLDLDSSAANTPLEAKLLLDSFSETNFEDQLAFRQDLIYKARLQPRSLVYDEQLVMDPGGAYLVTGGLGAVGMASASWLCSRGARRIILMSRSGLPERVEWKNLPEQHAQFEIVRFVRSLEAKGCHIEAVTVDIANLVDLQAYLHDRRNKDLPEIRGVIHVAGVLRDAQLKDATPRDIKEIFAPKVQGALNLWTVFDGNALDFMMLFSSFASVFPVTGQGVYAASNAFLDSWSYYLRGLGVRSASVDWGPWKTGMMLRAGSEHFFASRGVFAMQPDSCVSLMDEFVGNNSAQWIVAALDWPLVYKSRPYTPPMVLELCVVPTASGDASLLDHPEELLQRLQQALPESRSAMLTTGLSEIIAWVFRMSPVQLEQDQPLTAYGLDSIMAVELNNRLDRVFKLRISVVELLKGISLKEIAERILKQMDDQGAPSASDILAEADSDELARVLAEIEGMSMSDIEEELQKTIIP